MSADDTAALTRLIGAHPAALRSVRWEPSRARGAADRAESAHPLASADYLEIETKHGQVVIIEPGTGNVYANPPRPDQVEPDARRRQQDLTEAVPLAFDGRPVITDIVPASGPFRGWRILLSTGVTLNVTPDTALPTTSVERPGPSGGAPSAIRYQPANRHDHAEILALNEAAIPAVNRIDAAQLAGLHDQAEVLLVARAQDRVAGFLLALNERADYGSPNFRYFRDRYDSFFYVDRIVIDEALRGRGIGAGLYAALFDRPGRPQRVACEVNLTPPNPDSLRFHEGLGFRVVGEQDTEGGAKRVALMIRTVTAED
ncbi:MAG TPA: GNAT family N-acetyltransferase [Pseudomonadales bacterium]